MKAKGFLEFVREQGVIGLAVGFILGGSVSQVVTALVNDIINPVLGIALGAAGDLESVVINLGPSEILLGHFVKVLINFAVVAAVVYYGIKGLGLEKLDKKK